MEPHGGADFQRNLDVLAHQMSKEMVTVVPEERNFETICEQFEVQIEAVQFSRQGRVLNTDVFFFCEEGELSTWSHRNEFLGGLVN